MYNGEWERGQGRGWLIPSGRRILWLVLAGGEGDGREWDGWMASPTRWTWVLSKLRELVTDMPGRPGILWFMGLQRVGHDWATELVHNRTDFWTLWGKARMGWSETTALKHVYYQVWNRPPVQIGCMRQVLGAGAPGWPRGIGWGGRWEGGLGWGTYVNPWLIHVNVWQKPLQYCKVVSLQLIKIIGKKIKIINK